MLYREQQQIELLNKQILDTIISAVSAEEFIEYYIYHNQKETLEHFGLRNVKQLRKILEYFNYDFTKPKPSKFKGKASARSHESYVEAGKWFMRASRLGYREAREKVLRNPKLYNPNGEEF